MRYYLIAGEASGDLHGASLMKHILNLDPQAQFRFWGGDKMLQHSSDLVKHHKETSFMGITDVALNIRTIFKYIKLCKEDILLYKPDALILIDYPGFNMKIARFAKENKIPVHYYISPKVWAWNTKRAHKIRKYVDYLYSILPFEKEFFKPFKVVPDYVGNPICDAIEQYPFEENFKENHQLQEKTIALLPGSRMSELKHVFPKMLSVCKSFPEYQFIVAGASHIDESTYENYYQGIENIKLIRGKTYDVVKNTDAALVCSGTATLETALLNCPQVVCYKFSSLSYFIGRLVIKVKYISLVNLIMDKEIVKELIQDELNELEIWDELKKCLNPESRAKMLSSYAALKIKVGGPGASQKAAELIVGRTLN